MRKLQTCLYGTLLVYLVLFVFLDVLNEGFKLFLFFLELVCLLSLYFLEYIYCGLFEEIFLNNIIVTNSFGGKKERRKTGNVLFVFFSNKWATWLMYKPDRQQHGTWRYFLSSETVLKGY